MVCDECEVAFSEVILQLLYCPFDSQSWLIYITWCSSPLNSCERTAPRVDLRQQSGPKRNRKSDFLSKGDFVGASLGIWKAKSAVHNSCINHKKKTTGKMHILQWCQTELHITICSTVTSMDDCQHFCSLGSKDYLTQSGDPLFVFGFCLFLTVDWPPRLMRQEVEEDDLDIE